MVYLTGDTHGDFRRVAVFCDIQETTTDDILVILGDAGINYQKQEYAAYLKKEICQLPITLLCVHGNHEARPQTIASYHEMAWNGGTVMVEDEYPNILFAIDGEVYDLDGRKALVIGGAFSVDKEYRLMTGHRWFADEQPSPEIKARVEQRIRELGNRIELVLSHTCPFHYEPTEMYLTVIDQNVIDTSTEEWLDKIEDDLDYDAWFCGHWHTNKTIDKIHFLLDSVVMLPGTPSAFAELSDDSYPHNTRLRGDEPDKD